ncbi:hypothetical protein F5Y09DRAFT_357206 [Xylaria sp. FL1042]|nr:hypothetical protein F5Y09DRAFT_357206 [Xylaria sp. FL1042]
MAAPHHRHQSSLEGIIDFSTKPLLETDQRIKAKNRFYNIIERFNAKNNSNRTFYKRSRLIRYTYKYALSEASKNNFLLAFFRAIKLSINKNRDISFKQIKSAFFDFTDYLLNNFFLPYNLLKTSGKKTPQPSPAIHSAVQRAQENKKTQGYIKTPDQISTLQHLCLVRNRHRYMISQKFNQRKAIGRFDYNHDNAQDNNRTLLSEKASFNILKIAHILPHSLTKVNTNLQLDPSKKAALAVLNIFNNSIRHLIKSININRPRNAITLTHSLHNLFRDFKIFFKPVPSSKQFYTYQIDSLLPIYVSRTLGLPLTRTLYCTSNRTIDPPSPQLLAVHHAIAYILHLSAAGEYIDRLLRDADKDGGGIREDGSTDLGRLYIYCLSYLRLSCPTICRTYFINQEQRSAQAK